MEILLPIFVLLPITNVPAIQFGVLIAYSNQPVGSNRLALLTIRPRPKGYEGGTKNVLEGL